MSVKDRLEYNHWTINSFGTVKEVQYFQLQFQF